ncbi:hypothetical conserved protein [Candidatus Nitrosoglobus terrae]|uniref:Hypothetical conserved protein n=1 Tax=Candidatus Nitrosoglobus terrae TaxID=1630141 RepID=A0A1Q2SMP3_9GAMM|nr:TraK family protein [Candidatus Nitrosoglobus terrae]BAW80391.1 hypothetical conserved protein [Candidatus Nitrosoglobus terrae]
MNLSDELKQRIKANGQRGSGCQAFLARGSEISQALENGHTAKEIWALLREKGVMPIQYRTFTHYINRYLKNYSQQTTTLSLLKAKMFIGKLKQRKGQLTKKFIFDAKGKSKEDLI